MADKKKLEVFAKTGPGQQPEGDISDLDAGHVRPIGIGLREGEITALDSIAAEYGISRGGVIKIVLRLFIRDYRAGKVDLSAYVEEPLPQKNRYTLPK
jgi:hypothetical protein